MLSLMKTIYSLLPELKNEMGHCYEYALSVKRAAEMNAWRHAAWVPTNCEFESLPDFWEKNLVPDIRSPKTFQHFFAYRAALRKLPNPSGTVLFLEQFRFAHLLVLFFALIFNPRFSELWILYRYAPNQMKKKDSYMPVC